MKDHFGDDIRGRRSAFYFLPWHFGFFCRYRPLDEEQFLEASKSHPLIQSSRIIDDLLVGEEVSRLEALLRCTNDEAHNTIANVLWDAGTDAEAVEDLIKIAESNQLHDWEEELKSGGRDGRDASGRSSSRAEIDAAQQG
eukprot:CAMPEP_0197540850 /NCGR_PEP_ID=MMETSP1318-20131121/66832_1 /TAXON_ID=552666 /ORGANISM="Partenskyella glossopodia, Strain RCC365" /LENGTH=139 /DNA_ID=CAMNT_0043099957 /DNA_START=625 /DNA_END=1044 /DNA_ORIENTATION=-